MKTEFNCLEDLLAFNIKYYRYLNNYSQEMLAELCNLSPRYITDIERGKHCPTFSKLEKIAKTLNIEPYQLLMNIERDMDIINRMKNNRQYNQNISMGSIE